MKLFFSSPSKSRKLVTAIRKKGMVNKLNESTGSMNGKKLCVVCHGVYNKKYYSKHLCTKTIKPRAVPASLSTLINENSDFLNIIGCFREDNPVHALLTNTIFKEICFNQFEILRNEDKMSNTKRRLMSYMRCISHLFTNFKEECSSMDREVIFTDMFMPNNSLILKSVLKKPGLASSTAVQNCQV